MAVRLQGALRLLALVTLIVATPLAIFKLSWLPVTVKIFAETALESTAGGTPGYIKEHAERVWRLATALALYAAGLAAIIGLAGVVTGVCRHPTTQAITWIFSLLVGISLPFFDASRIGPTTDREYIFVVIYLPIGVAVLSAAALTAIFLMGRKSRQKSAGQEPNIKR